MTTTTTPTAYVPRHQREPQRTQLLLTLEAEVATLAGLLAQVAGMNDSTLDGIIHGLHRAVAVFQDGAHRDLVHHEYLAPTDADKQREADRAAAVRRNLRAEIAHLESTIAHQGNVLSNRYRGPVLEELPPQRTPAQVAAAAAEASAAADPLHQRLKELQQELKGLEREGK